MRCVQHHLDDTFHIAIGRGERSDLDAEAAGKRGAHLIRIKLLAFDLARFEDVFGQGAQNGLAAQRDTERFHASDQLALAQPEASQLRRYPGLIPTEVRPFITLMDIHFLIIL
ncbi:MAG: hypothetical protein MUE84_17210 [Hyphomonas sp.]|nr:hypothetical protein [Hyphomonas sp.]